MGCDAWLDECLTTVFSYHLDGSYQLDPMVYCVSETTRLRMSLAPSDIQQLARKRVQIRRVIPVTDGEFGEAEVDDMDPEYDADTVSVTSMLSDMTVVTLLDGERAI